MRTQSSESEENPSAVTRKVHRLSVRDTEICSSVDQILETPPPAVIPDDCFPSVPGYEILGQIGSGGMGIVYEARHRELNRRVAIKMLRGESLANPDARERFRAEAEAIARLQHTNIIQVFEIGTLESQPNDPNPRPYIVLEFVDGGNLHQRPRTPQPPREAARLVESLARAAHAAHKLGIIHRDLKPANVLLTKQGEPKIADFGIAKQLEANETHKRKLTRSGTLMGTPEYMAPEQFLEATPRPAIDIYSLGVILYELLIGHVPFQGATFADTMVLSLRQDPVPLRQLQPHVPVDLEVICLKCLEKSPGRRYASAEALAEDLERWQEGRPIEARPVGMLERTFRWTRRNPEIAGLSMAVILVGFMGLIGIVWNWREARRNAQEASEYAIKAQVAATQARDAANKERWERYRVSLVAASSALRLYDRTASRQALDNAPSEYRDWVWNLLNTRLDRARKVLCGIAKATVATKLTPDCKWAVLRGEQSHFRIWNLETQQEYVYSYEGKNYEPFAVSPDGSAFAYLASPTEINVVEIPGCRVKFTLKGHHASVHNLIFGSKGKQLISHSNDHSILIWDTATGLLLRNHDTETGQDGVFKLSEDQKIAAISDDATGEVRVWELESGRTYSRFRNDFKILFMEFDSTSRRIATVDLYPSNLIRIWDVSTGRLLFTLKGHENQLKSLRFSKDSTRLASCSMDRTIRIWDITSRSEISEPAPLAVLKGHTGWVSAAAFNPDGSRLVSVSQDRTVRYWDANSGDQLTVLLGHLDDVHEASFTPDGSAIITSSSDGTLRLWDVQAIERNNALKGHGKYVYSVAFHPDGVRIASASWDGTARIWNVASAQPLHVLDHGPNQIVSSVVFHPSGKYLATLARDNSLRLWNPDSGQLVHRWEIPSYDWRDSRIAFCPAGKFLAAGSHDGHIRIWDVESRELVETCALQNDAIRDLAYSPDGQLLASAGEGNDRSVRIWDVVNRKSVARLTGHTHCVYTVAWNKKGSLLASGSTDGTMKIWDTRTWKLVGTVRHGVNVYSVAFTPDGKLIAAGCADNLIRFTDAESLQSLAELSGHTDYVHSLAFSPDGTRMISGSGDRTVRIWDALPPDERANRLRNPSQP